jgi:hypothetical protein
MGDASTSSDAIRAVALYRAGVEHQDRKLAYRVFHGLRVLFEPHDFRLNEVGTARV